MHMMASSDRQNFLGNNDGPGHEKKRLKILCLHGYLSSSKYFRLQLRRLVEDGGDLSDFGNAFCSSPV